MRQRYLTGVRGRWLKSLKGVLDKGVLCGEFDTEIALALRFNWTPEQVGRMDPDFIDELAEALRAEAKHTKGKRDG